MGNTLEKLQYIEGTKKAIRAAIKGAGVDVEDSDTFRSYAGKIEDNFTGYYGVQWDVTNPDPSCQRIGTMTFHATLPIQSQMRGCLLNDNGTVNYYLMPGDWSKDVDGNDANLDGIDGQVMIEIPSFFWKFETDGDYRRVKLSENALDGFVQVPKMYVSAFEASLDRTNSKLSSVVNASAQYRGGNNDASKDELFNSLLGMPASSISQTNFRTYARSRGNGWEQYSNLSHNVIMWLFIVEFATRNSQKAVNGETTERGYKQGGLGNGVTTADSTEWSDNFAYNPFIVCGASNELGNYTGEVSVTVADFGGTGEDRTFTVPRYRGIENPFGHCWKFCDGVLIKIQSDVDGGESKVYTSNSPDNWNDSDVSNYVNRGNLPRTNGYMSEVIFGENGETLPKVVVGGSSTYWCDYFYTLLPSVGTSVRTRHVGGSANTGSVAGLGFSSSYYSPSFAFAYIVSRLCYFE